MDSTNGANQDQLRTVRRTALRSLFALILAVAILALIPTPKAWAGEDWKHYESDGIGTRSADGKAVAKGSVKWYHGKFPKGYLHRGDYSRGSKVVAKGRVGCIWAKVNYGYPTGSITVGSGVGGTISPGEKSGEYSVSCRRRGKARPAALRLSGVGYAKALLNSTTLEICTSSSEREGPRHCVWEKNHYGDFPRA